MSAYYAVAKGKTVGIFLTWNECNDSVKGYSGAVYKKFKTKQEAETFLEHANALGNSNPTVNSSMVFIPDYYVYTDGACSNNGRENARAGIGIFFAIDDSRNVSKALDGKQTNNSAELTAILDVYTIIEADMLAGKNIAIVTDSDYSIKCLTTYGEKCSLKNWNITIPNRDLVRSVYERYKNTGIQFIHVNSHTNNTDIHSIGNFYADKLANEAIGLTSCPYQGK